jgi:Ca2+-binding EF-hand superfamily protein
LAFNSKIIMKAFFSYFANILTTPQDREHFSDIFRELDLDGDGILTAEEFEEAMAYHYQGEEVQKEIARRMVKKGTTMELHGKMTLFLY